MKTQSINGAANTTTIDTYDALSRITQFTNPLGVFNQTYDPVNLMPKTLTAPNGLTTTLDFHPAAADLRLKEIKHTLTGNVALSKHVYGYKPANSISQTICVILFLNLGLTVVGRVGEQEIFMCLGGF
jgi:hypothetical protein